MYQFPAAGGHVGSGYNSSAWGMEEERSISLCTGNGVIVFPRNKLLRAISLTFKHGLALNAFPPTYRCNMHLYTHNGHVLGGVPMSYSRYMSGVMFLSG